MGQGSLEGGGSGRGGFCPNSLCLCPFLVPESKRANGTLENPVHARGGMLALLLVATIHLSLFTGEWFNDWETDFYTPPVLGGAALFDNSAPALYSIQGP